MESTQDALRQPEVLTVELEPGARDVRDRLLEHGASAAFTAGVVQAVQRSGAPGAYAIDVAARAIGRSVSILPAPKRSRRRKASPHVFVFVGPTGVGKTTTLAKLARHLSGRVLSVASLDAVGLSALEGVGGVEADVDRQEVPLVAVSSADQLKKHLRKHPRTEVVLLDTPGISPRDEAGMKALSREIERLAEKTVVDVFLVLPATKSRASLELALQAFRRLTPTACVLTKLDETDEPAPALEEVARERLPVAFLCDGQDARAHIRRPTPDRFAELFLRGRLA